MSLPLSRAHLKPEMIARELILQAERAGLEGVRVSTEWSTDSDGQPPLLTVIADHNGYKVACYIHPNDLTRSLDDIANRTLKPVAALLARALQEPQP